jgi:thiamine-phosphate pyrophosphorylase
LFPALYAILDPTLIPAITKEPLAEFAAQLSDAGVELMQLRHKRATPRQLFSESRALAEQLTGTGVRLIVNDRPDIAAMIGAGGVHVGQEDLPVETARAISRNCAKRIKLRQTI